MVARQLGIYASGVYLIILDEALGGRLVVLHVVVAHAQHVDGLFGLVRAFHDGYQLVQQGGGTGILAFGEVAFGGFVSPHDVSVRAAIRAMRI